MTKNADIEKLVDMIFAMVKEFAQNLKRENHQRKQRKKARLSTMPKAILELEMPVSCETCPIKRYFHYGWVEYICVITGEEITNKGRRSDCPLKLVEGKEVEP